MNRAALDDVIGRLVDARRRRRPASAAGANLLLEGEIRQLCSRAKDVFMRQPNLLELDAPINICGIYK
jgi:serine/threonine-protein phosphatase PP1 catalytic subunit